MAVSATVKVAAAEYLASERLGSEIYALLTVMDGPPRHPPGITYIPRLEPSA